jgi:hypothetical protein
VADQEYKEEYKKEAELGEEDKDALLRNQLL